MICPSLITGMAVTRECLVGGKGNRDNKHNQVLQNLVFRRFVNFPHQHGYPIFFWPWRPGFDTLTHTNPLKKWVLCCLTRPFVMVQFSINWETNLCASWPIDFVRVLYWVASPISKEQRCHALNVQTLHLVSAKLSFEKLFLGDMIFSGYRQDFQTWRGVLSEKSVGHQCHTLNCSMLT